MGVPACVACVASGIAITLVVFALIDDKLVIVITVLLVRMKVPAASLLASPLPPPVKVKSVPTIGPALKVPEGMVIVTVVVDVVIAYAAEVTIAALAAGSGPRIPNKSDPTRVSNIKVLLLIDDEDLSI